MLCLYLPGCVRRKEWADGKGLVAFGSAYAAVLMAVHLLGLGARAPTAVGFVAAGGAFAAWLARARWGQPRGKKDGGAAGAE